MEAQPPRPILHFERSVRILLIHQLVPVVAVEAGIEIVYSRNLRIGSFSTMSDSTIPIFFPENKFPGELKFPKYFGGKIFLNISS